MARVRSPNYPALSLPAAVERVSALHKVEGRNVISREAMVKHFGFSSLNGASATILSALGKYGLIEAAGDGEARVSELALRIIAADPDEPTDKQEAIAEAAFRPALFSELREKWPERRPSDESLRSYLVRKGFSQGALDQVIQFYRETLDMVGHGPAGDSRRASTLKEPAMHSSPVSHPNAPSDTVIQPPSGRPFSVAFDGSVLTGSLAIRSVRDLDRLMKVLAAQKAAFEAMEEEIDDPEIRVLLDGPDLSEH